MKNLENVQGDERDVIFISTAYGPDAVTGVVMNRFGPINGKHGHRRLNVLFTRAKDRVEVFTSMRPTDIRTDEASQLGARTLKAYLEYAETGKLDAGATSGREPDSEFEELVRDRLQEKGFEVVPQVGVAGYFIDLAVKHPKRSGFVLGIECDGASYPFQAPLSALSRDRLRQQVLERLFAVEYLPGLVDGLVSESGSRVSFGKLLTHLDRLVRRGRLRLSDIISSWIICQANILPSVIRPPETVKPEHAAVGNLRTRRIKIGVPRRFRMETILGDVLTWSWFSTAWLQLQQLADSRSSGKYLYRPGRAER